MRKLLTAEHCATERQVSTPRYIYVDIKMVMTGDELCSWIEALLQNLMVI